MSISGRGNFGDDLENFSYSFEANEESLKEGKVQVTFEGLSGDLSYTMECLDLKNIKSGEDYQKTAKKVVDTIIKNSGKMLAVMLQPEEGITESLSGKKIEQMSYTLANNKKETQLKELHYSDTTGSKINTSPLDKKVNDLKKDTALQNQVNKIYTLMHNSIDPNSRARGSHPDEDEDGSDTASTTSSSTSRSRESTKSSSTEGSESSRTSTSSSSGVIRRDDSSESVPKTSRSKGGSGRTLGGFLSSDRNDRHGSRRYDFEEDSSGVSSVSDDSSEFRDDGSEFGNDDSQLSIDETSEFDPKKNKPEPPSAASTGGLFSTFSSLRSFFVTSLPSSSGDSSTSPLSSSGPPIPEDPDERLGGIEELVQSLCPKEGSDSSKSVDKEVNNFIKIIKKQAPNKQGEIIRTLRALNAEGILHSISKDTYAEFRALGAPKGIMDALKVPQLSLLKEKLMGFSSEASGMEAFQKAIEPGIITHDSPFWLAIEKLSEKDVWKNSSEKKQLLDQAVKNLGVSSTDLELVIQKAFHAPERDDSDERSMSSESSASTVDSSGSTVEMELPSVVKGRSPVNRGKATSLSADAKKAKGFSRESETFPSSGSTNSTVTFSKTPKDATNSAAALSTDFNALNNSELLRPVATESATESATVGPQVKPGDNYDKVKGHLLGMCKQKLPKKGYFDEYIKQIEDFPTSGSNSVWEAVKGYIELLEEIKSTKAREKPREIQLEVLSKNKILDDLKNQLTNALPVGNRRAFIAVLETLGREPDKATTPAATAIATVYAKPGDKEVRDITSLTQENWSKAIETFQIQIAKDRISNSVLDSISNIIGKQDAIFNDGDKEFYEYKFRLSYLKSLVEFRKELDNQPKLKAVGLELISAAQNLITSGFGDKEFETKLREFREKGIPEKLAPRLNEFTSYPGKMGFIIRTPKKDLGGVDPYKMMDLSLSIEKDLKEIQGSKLVSGASLAKKYKDLMKLVQTIGDHEIKASLTNELEGLKKDIERQEVDLSKEERNNPAPEVHSEKSIHSTADVSSLPSEKPTTVEILRFKKIKEKGFVITQQNFTEVFYLVEQQLISSEITSDDLSAIKTLFSNTKLYPKIYPTHSEYSEYSLKQSYLEQLLNITTLLKDHHDLLKQLQGIALGLSKSPDRTKINREINRLKKSLETSSRATIEQLDIFTEHAFHKIRIFKLSEEDKLGVDPYEFYDNFLRLEKQVNESETKDIEPSEVISFVSLYNRLSGIIDEVEDPNLKKYFKGKLTELEKKIYKHAKTTFEKMCDQASSIKDFDQLKGLIRFLKESDLEKGINTLIETLEATAVERPKEREMLMLIAFNILALENPSTNAVKKAEKAFQLVCEHIWCEDLNQRDENKKAPAIVVARNFVDNYRKQFQADKNYSKSLDDIKSKLEYDLKKHMKGPAPESEGASRASAASSSVPQQVEAIRGVILSMERFRTKFEEKTKPTHFSQMLQRVSDENIKELQNYIQDNWEDICNVYHTNKPTKSKKPPSDEQIILAEFNRLVLEIKEMGLSH